MRRRDVVPGYVEFTAAVHMMGFADLLKGSAPSIEAAIRGENKRRERDGRPLLPSLPQLIEQQTERFRKRGIPAELRQRVNRWADLKGGVRAGGI